MRRMATTKQLDYINDVSEVAEKGFQVGTYPESIDIINEGEFDWSWILADIEDELIDFENHKISEGACMSFDISYLTKKYGLVGEDGDYPASISFEISSDTITMPNSVVDFESLKAWMQSQAFISELEGAGYSFNDYYIRNNVAKYQPDDPADNIVLVNGELKLNTYVVCKDGLGEEIVGASDPVGEPTLDVNLLRVEKPMKELRFANNYIITSIDINVGDMDEELDIKIPSFIVGGLNPRFLNYLREMLSLNGIAYLSAEQATWLVENQPDTLYMGTYYKTTHYNLINNLIIQIGNNQYIWDWDVEGYKLTDDWDSTGVSNGKPITVSLSRPSSITDY